MNVIWSIKKAAKALFISVEAVYFIGMMLLKTFKLSFFTKFGTFIYSSESIVSFFTLGFPIAILIYAMTIQNILLQPQEKIAILVEWPDYKEYKITTFIGLLFCILPIPPTFVSWMMKDYYSEHDLGFFYLLLVGISLISVTSLYFAKFTIKEILSHNE
jgi:hypothetical protein